MECKIVRPYCSPRKKRRSPNDLRDPRERAVQLREKVFIITGGGSGLGAAVARRFADAGARVILADINGEAATVLISTEK